MKTKVFKLIALCIILSITACSSNDTNEDKSVISEKDSYEYYVNSTMQKSIDNLSITIHKGLIPPNVEGIYVINLFYCAKSTKPNDTYADLVFGASTLTLSNQDTAKLSVDFKNFLI